jgi:hypothetical protein
MGLARPQRDAAERCSPTATSSTDGTTTEPSGRPQRADLRRDGVRREERHRNGRRRGDHPTKRGARIGRHPRSRRLFELPAIAQRAGGRLGEPDHREVTPSSLCFPPRGDCLAWAQAERLILGYRPYRRVWPGGQSPRRCHQIAVGARKGSARHSLGWL